MTLSGVARGLAFTTGVIALAGVFPWPVFALWQIRYVVLESTLVTAPLALAALVLALVARDRPAAAAALFAVMVLGVPAVAQIACLVRSGAPFSPLAYLGLDRGPAVIVRRDVIVDPARPDLPLDLYLPAGRGPHPLLVVVHGGSWHGGEKGMAPHVSRMAAAEGWVVADVTYRLAPAHQLKDVIGDVKCALGHLHAGAGQVAVDPHRAVLLGRSAGGQIALTAAYSAGDPRLPPSCAVPDEPVVGVVSLYGPTDLAWGHANPIRPDIPNGPESLEKYLGGPPAQAAEAYRLGTPQSWLDRFIPDTLLIHGTGDRFVRPGHSVRLRDAIDARKGHVTLLEIPFAEHGFDVRRGGIADQIALHAIRGLLARAPIPVHSP